MRYDEPDPPEGRGVARTGVTVLDLGGDAWAAPVPAGLAVLNGAGELTGSLQVREWGLIETPVFLTSTMQVGRVYDAAVTLLLAEQPGIGDDVVIPVVGECDDSWLNDPRVGHVTRPTSRRRWLPHAGRPGPRCRRPRARSVRAPAWSASAGRAGSAPPRGSSRPGTPSACCC